MFNRAIVRKKNQDVLLLTLSLLLMMAGNLAFSLEPIVIKGDEDGIRLHPNLEIWHDPSGKKRLADAIDASILGEFKPLLKPGSTGLQPGAFWSRFYLHNVTSQDLTMHLEYVDHQLIYLNVFQSSNEIGQLKQIANLNMNRPISERPIAHHRFVVPVSIAPGATAELYVQYGSDDKGFVFPNMRLWAPEKLRYMQAIEISTLSFISGGLLLMALVALMVGLATGVRVFYAYCAYALSKIAVWWTVIGLTHQFVITENFHWSYMSLSGALSILAAIWFARMFLQTRRYIPRFDYILVFMLANAVFLVFAALTKQTALAVISITIALLLYPLISIAGVIRWCQGSREAAIFAIAWAFLVIALFTQALRDLGFLQSNFLNYYWPPIASYTEMIVILFAMGLNLRRLRSQKESAEHKYTVQLETKKMELEALVLERTKDLESAKSVAEVEARTDPLTGASNRRSFFRQANEFLERSKHRNASFSVLMFDIDHFKAINDTYGHNVGDQALCLFAKTIMIEIRDTDIFGRLGGEEFSLLLIGSDDASIQTAERLREVVSNISVATGFGPLTFTTSIGVAHYNNQKNIEELLCLADTALYDAKQNGRNKVRLAEQVSN